MKQNEYTGAGNIPVGEGASLSPQERRKPVSPHEKVRNMEYYDWLGVLPVLKTAWRNKLHVLIVGPKGSGKTSLVRYFCQQEGIKLYEVNFSLRTRESHLIGTMTLTDYNGSTITKFEEGVLVKSMRDSLTTPTCFYGDEINASEPDVLLRLDEALDDRRQITLKESDKYEVVKARDWFSICTINPLTHTGTKALPPQLISRFGVKVYLPYPPKDIEVEIVSRHLGKKVDGDLEDFIDIVTELRKLAEVGEISYSPSIRETIAFGRLIESGMKPIEAATYTLTNLYYQYEGEAEKVKSLVRSKFEAVTT